MKKTDSMFIIHNYNTVPDELLTYCKDYVIYDCSSDDEIRKKLKEGAYHVIDVSNTGHNITTYFKYFADNYEALPDVMCLLKGNIIGRHCTREFFERVYDNKYFTFLYSDRNVQITFGVNGLVMENMYIEKNESSIYVSSPNHPHIYFDDLNRLMKFIYKDPVIPTYCLFSPGACYIVRKEQVLKHGKEFYLNLNKIMSYGFNPGFPSEAHQVERLLPTIFNADYEVNEWMNSGPEFDRLIEKEKQITAENERYKKEHRLAIRFQNLLKRFH